MCHIQSSFVGLSGLFLADFLKVEPLRSTLDLQASTSLPESSAFPAGFRFTRDSLPLPDKTMLRLESKSIIR